MPTFQKYLQSKGYSYQTVQGYYSDLSRFIEWTEDEQIETGLTTYSELLSYIKHLQIREVKQVTIQRYIGSLNHYFNWLIEQEIREDNPTTQINIKGIKRRTLYPILSKPELEQLYAGLGLIEGSENNQNQNWYKASVLTSKRNKVITGLLVYQGLTSSELGRLTVQDVKLREGKIYIGGSRKSNERTLKLEPHQVLDIMEYTLTTRNELLQLSGKQSDKLIVSTGSSDRVSNILQKLLPKLKAINSKIENVQHIRASVITNWLKQYNLREVQYRAGHRYVSSTESYQINDIESLQEDIIRFHPL